MKKRLIIPGIAALSLLLWALSSTAATRPYDEAADAGTELQAGLSKVRQQQKYLLVIFGANWCPDCRALDTALRGKLGELIDSRFVVVKVDVGNFDKNMDLSARYGMPTQKGIPAAVVIGADNNVLYATKAGELANARRMSENGLYDFFSSVIGQMKATRSPD